MRHVFLRALVQSFLLFLLVCTNLYALSINVYIEGPRGGFGDVASNLIMAKKLKAQSPDAVINIIINQNNSRTPGDASLAIQAVQVLEPRFKPASVDPKHELVQTIDGINYYLSSSEHVPRADYLVDFSSVTKFSELPELTAKASMTLSFYEYSGVSAEYVFTVDPIPGSNPVIRLSAGAGSVGFYISPERPQPKISRQELAEHLSKISTRELKKRPKTTYPPGGEPVVINQDTLIAAAYTFDIIATRTYIEAIKRAASTEKFKSKKIIIFVKNMEGLGDLSNLHNVRIVPYDSMPFNVSEALIAHSNFPPIVTGDVSLTLCLEYEKPFFYERMPWKVEATFALASKLIKSRATSAEQLRMSQWSKALEIPGQRLRPGQSEEELVKMLYDLILDDQVQAEFRQAIQDIRADVSLPANLTRYLQLLDTLEYKHLTKADLKFLMLATLDVKELNDSPLTVFALRNPDVEQRKKAIEILGKVKKEHANKVIPTLLLACEDSDSKTRKAALVALEKTALIEPAAKETLQTADNESVFFPNLLKKYRARAVDKVAASLGLPTNWRESIKSKDQEVASCLKRIRKYILGY